MNMNQDALAAGTSTSIDAIEWAMAECIHNPYVMTRAQDELDAVVGRARRVEDANIPNLKYLQAIVKETLRLHLLPLLLPRDNHTACKVFGYDIPAGTMLMVNAWAVCRDPTIFEDPGEFKPERFVEGKNAETDVQGNHFELLPFGAGRRACPGTSLALAMLHIQTATLLHCYDWVAPDLDMSIADGNVPYLAKPLCAIPRPRLSFLY